MEADDGEATGTRGDPSMHRILVHASISRKIYTHKLMQQVQYSTAHSADEALDWELGAQRQQPVRDGWACPTANLRRGYLE